MYPKIKNISLVHLWAHCAELLEFQGKYEKYDQIKLQFSLLTLSIFKKVKKELLPCLRSFTSSLRVAELVWNEGTLIKDYPPESYDIKCMDDTWDYLKTENAVSKFESYIRGWMKQIQELLLESEQLRLETDDAGPQV